MGIVMPRVSELTLRWARIPSITGEELPLLKLVEADLIDFDWQVQRIPVWPGNRYNLLAGTATGRILFTTHLDTVPPFITPAIDGDTLRGRGVVDAKGQAASMLVAAMNLKRMNVNTSLLFLVGEETDSDGAKAADEFGLSFDYIINGEPTGNRFAEAQKGNVRIELQASGVSCHSGYPDFGRSAIETLLTVIGEIVDSDWPTDDRLGPTTINIGTIHGGIADNVLADQATARLMFRIVCPWKDMVDRLDQMINNRLKMHVIKGVDPLYFHCPEGFPSTVVSFGSDAPFLQSIGTVMMVGPGSILQAHTVSESIAVKELEEAVSLYMDVARKLSGGEL